MPNVPITGLPAAAAATAAALLPCVIAGTTQKVTQAQLFAVGGNVGTITLVGAVTWGTSGVNIGGGAPDGDLFRLTLARNNVNDDSAPLQFGTDATVYQIRGNGQQNGIEIAEADSQMQTFTANYNNGSALLTAISINTALLSPGQVITSPVMFRAVILSVDSPTQVTLDQNFSSSGAGTFGAFTQGGECTLFCSAIQHRNNANGTSQAASVAPVLMLAGGVKASILKLSAKGTAGTPLAWTAGATQTFAPDLTATTYILAQPTGNVKLLNPSTGSTFATPDNRQVLEFVFKVPAAGFGTIQLDTQYSFATIDQINLVDIAGILTNLEAVTAGTWISMAFSYSTALSKWILFDARSY